jgi:hypothetical protein
MVSIVISARNVCLDSGQEEMCAFKKNFRLAIQTYNAIGKSRDFYHCNFPDLFALLHSTRQCLMLCFLLVYPYLSFLMNFGLVNRMAYIKTRLFAVSLLLYMFLVHHLLQSVLTPIWVLVNVASLLDFDRFLADYQFV